MSDKKGRLSNRWCLFYIAVLSVGFCWRFKSGRWKTFDIPGRHTPVEDARIPVEH